MAAIFEMTWLPVSIGDSGAGSWVPCTDGTYVWFVTAGANAPGVRRLWRLRHSDKALIRPDGSVGTTADAYQTLVNSVNDYHSLAVAGNYVAVSYVGTGLGGIKMWARSNMAGPVNKLASCLGGGYQIATDGTYFYVPDYLNGTGRMAISRIHATTGVEESNWYISVNTSTLAARAVFYANGHLYLFPASSTQPFEKITTAGVRVATSPLLSNAVPLRMAYDAIRDEIWCATGSGGEGYRFRCSDLSLLTPTGGVAGSYTAAFFNGGSMGSFIINGSAPFVVGDQVYLGGTNAMQRRNTDPSRMVASLGYGTTGCLYTNQSPYVLSPGCLVGSTLYYGLGATGANYAYGGIAWHDVLSATPNLTDVSPLVGGKVRATFDAAIGISGPTIGPRVGPIKVNTVTAPDSTHVDVALSVRGPVSGVGF